MSSLFSDNGAYIDFWDGVPQGDDDDDDVFLLPAAILKRGWCVLCIYTYVLYVMTSIFYNTVYFSGYSSKKILHELNLTVLRKRLFP